MTTLDKQITARKLRNRYYPKPAVDPIKDAAIIEQRVRQSVPCSLIAAAVIIPAVVVVLGMLS